ncbi:siderophore ABC transporter substrate-binding protein [Microbacterium maritypicum]|uniref:siderophore ABC transporter substrate-binding protein n=1 Tax=Microbacterium TaxID=33882 RepID=UPI000493A5B6|nr:MULTISPECIES: ABC transporter substrate-binding protein [Microbacterium]MCV0335472.1 ABC transporter substrate-binding protein [Microbacterium sp.]MCV0376010.1 ABC transporter substrate-binding protein [Microbacterium sp.]MCV0390266.1 ABC transporter substrate-binding protein [Microbacterium sp.]MCV0418001.1 ABC transporter substrate-binding protein [Microbacterium sp.]MCV0422331.1 ABC transporter substrate-binding protein [Microbacterium sp.]
MSVPRTLTATSAALVGLLALAGCTSGGSAEPEKTEPAAATVTIEDNTGTHEIATPPTSVVALDNRTFQTLSDWDVELSAGAVALMPETVSYVKDDAIVDIGLHSEPDLEAVVAVEPDLIISGQRFTQHNAAIADLVPDATIVDLEPREGEPFGDELKRQVTVLGEIFGKQDEAKKLVDDFDAAVERAKAAYDDADTVMAVNTSGGQIGYLAPTVGRSLGPIYDMLGLTPALEVDDATDDHQGDDISVEAIAASNPDWILVLDRDAVFAADTPDYVQAAEILESSEALAGVTAVKQKQIVYMPTDTYLNESIQTYTTFLDDLADALEKSAKN